MQSRIQCLTDYFRCPEEFVRFAPHPQTAGEPGFFRLGEKTLCYGFCDAGVHDHLNGNGPPDALKAVITRSGVVYLPFDPDQIVENLRREKYMTDAISRPGYIHPALRNRYYSVRPYLPVMLRKHLQRAALAGWEQIRFPNWPVDITVDHIHEILLGLLLRSEPQTRIPFIWFWPHGAPGCVMMTHDVETRAGRDSCTAVAEVDDEFGMKSSFHFVPEERYQNSPQLFAAIRDRGHEVNVQDLNHDGRLFETRAEFAHRVEKINRYGSEWKTAGFRSAVMYRNPDWYELLNVSYDMSIPNVAHLDAQRGGCCTVMPYFIGNILELPLTTVQDYSLFNILNDYSLTLWQEQTSTILARNGLASFLVHPDYIQERRALASYRRLLEYIRQLGSKQSVWVALPGEIDRWWRQRRRMKLARVNGGWQIQGDGAQKARIAYASMQGSRVVYNIQ